MGDDDDMGRCNSRYNPAIAAWRAEPDKPATSCSRIPPFSPCMTLIKSGSVTIDWINGFMAFPLSDTQALAR